MVLSSRITGARRLFAAPLSLASLILLMGSEAFGGNHPHKSQMVYAAQAPVMTYVAQAPVMSYVAQAPTTYVAQAPTTYVAQAPTAYVAQAPTTYVAQAPTTYVAQAPATVMTTASVGSAPVMTTTTATGAAPATGNAPSSEQNRITLAVRNAIIADLVSEYRSEESGTTRIEKIRSIRERAREAYESALEGETDPELNQAEQEDIRTLVDLVISEGSGGSQRTYYPQLAPPSNVAGYAPVGSYPNGAPTFLVAPAPTAVLVPVAPHHPLHHFKHRR